MTKSKIDPGVSSRIRESCAQGLEEAISVIAHIAKEGPSESLKISAFDKLGKYGVAGRGTVVYEDRGLLERLILLAIEVFQPPEAQTREFVSRAKEFIFGPSEHEDEVGPDDEADE
jgi:hypothetical protein